MTSSVTEHLLGIYDLVSGVCLYLERMCQPETGYPGINPQSGAMMQLTYSEDRIFYMVFGYSR